MTTASGSTIQMGLYLNVPTEQLSLAFAVQTNDLKNVKMVSLSVYGVVDLKIKLPKNKMHKIQSKLLALITKSFFLGRYLTFSLR